MAEPLPLVVHRFYTKFIPDPKAPGGKSPRDMVEFGPIGSGDRTKVVEYVSRIRRVREDAGADPAAAMAKMIWDFIKPKYDAWKNGQDLPEQGIPLAAFNLLMPEQAEVLRASGVRTVEQLATLTDAHIQRIPIPNLRSLIQQAKTFLEAQDSNKVAAEIDTLRSEKKDLEGKVNELAEMVAALQMQQQKKPGRPKKKSEQPEAAA